MKGHGEKQSRKQEEAIVALLAHPTIPEAAKACGVGETALWRWLQDPDFQVAYRQAQRQIVEKAIVELQRACSDAVKTLTRNLNFGQPAVEVSAAKVILDRATKGVELSDLVERVEQLESLLAEQQEGNGKKCA
jgi:hypothetical protein